VTCVVGLVDRLTGAVHMGGDACGSSEGDRVARGDAKVFQRGPFLLGVSSSFRVRDLLRYELPIASAGLRHPRGMTPAEYMVRRFIPAVRRLVEAQEVSALATADTALLVGYMGEVFTVYLEDYSVGHHDVGYAAIGTGEPYAMGALRALAAAAPTVPPADRLLAALEAAATFRGDVMGPYTLAAMTPPVMTPPARSGSRVG
jgi:hypothetical protein